MADTVSAINRVSRLAVLESGAVVSVANLLDAFGDETDDAAECCFAIVQLPCGRWECCSGVTVTMSRGVTL